MKQYILLFAALFLQIAAFANGPINPKTFGAKGDGITDDTQAINRAFAAAGSTGLSVRFPAGIYLCNQVDAFGNVLSLPAGGHNGMKLTGDSAAILTTVTRPCVQLFVYAYGKDTGLSVTGLAFQNTHAPMIGTTNAIYFAGTGAQNFINLTVRNCSFSGYSAALLGQGINGWTVDDNDFGAPNGHDNAQTNHNPAIFLEVADNNNGKVTGMIVSNNHASGYTGPYPMVCRRPMDGFFYGTAYGVLTICGNWLQNFSQELIMIQPRPATRTDSIRILNNVLDCSLPESCMDDNGAPHRYNYAIRIDASNARIAGNTVINYTTGILARPVERPGYQQTGLIITGNRMQEGTNSVLYDPGAAVYISATPALPMTGVVIAGNRILSKGNPVQLYNAMATGVNKLLQIK